MPTTSDQSVKHDGLLEPISPGYIDDFEALQPFEEWGPLAPTSLTDLATLGTQGVDQGPSAGGDTHTHDGTGTNSTIVGGVGEESPGVPTASAAGAVGLGDYAVASGQGALAVGASFDADVNNAPTASGISAVALGASDGTGASEQGAQATGNYSIATGQGAAASSEDAIAIGHNAIASTGGDNVAIGPGSLADAAFNATALGSLADAGGTSATALGRATVASGGDSLAAGHSADATGLESTAIGVGAQATATVTTTVGSRATATQTEATAVGESADATGTEATALGADAQATAARTTALGANATASHADATAVGEGAATDFANTIVLGTTDETVKLTGGQRVRHITKTSTGTAGTGEHIYFLDTTSTGFTWNLPASPRDGQYYRVKWIAGAGTAILGGNGNNIDGAANFTFGTLLEAIDVVFNGTEWFIL